ncbi:MFS transporter [Mesobacillus foraminis]|uniref:MFS transporter n=1 Tax=Mesobacillus foraminis TaxID=279826 RepID=A0A4V2RE33_9BACI|nr:MFS transporter [Mesobacillus foraminis]MBT2755229.1 MFS transporter [Mesobacillus foraminis]TCN27150.1 MFS transporter [Mesobacillus foraminis]
MDYHRFLRAQSIMISAGSVVFPFYLLFIRNVGESFSQFGWAYGLFTLMSACSFPFIGRMADAVGERNLLLLYTWGMALVMLLIPIAGGIWAIYAIQILMGFLGAVQKTAEKSALSRQAYEKRHTDIGKSIGHYHLWTSVWSAAAIIVTGYLIDFLTIGSIFYLASFMYAYAGITLAGRAKQLAD